MGNCVAGFIGKAQVTSGGIKGNFHLLAFPISAKIIDLATERKGSHLTNKAKPATLCEISIDALQIEQRSLAAQIVGQARM